MSRLKFRDRIRRALQQTRENKFERQAAADWFADSWTKAQGLPLAIISIIGLNDRQADEIYKIFIEYLPFFALFFIFPYLIVATAFVWAFVVRLRETYADEPARIADGIPLEESTKQFAASQQTDNLAVGAVIQVSSYPYLDKRISNNGWHPNAVEIRPARRDFQVPDLLKSEMTFSGDNGRKFSLVRSSRPTTDDFRKLNLEVARTTYQQIEAARLSTDSNTELRHQLSSLLPEKHEIPNSLCLHAVALLNDDTVLAMKRRENTSYFPGAISVSFEEQIGEIDFTTPGIEASESLFRRAICEEIFPLATRYEIDPKDTWARVSRSIDHYRYWSLIFEESIANFALFGVCKLRLSLSEYLTEFREIQKEYGGSRDDEGKMYYMTLTNVRDYLRSGHGVVRSLNFFDNNIELEEAIRSSHPTMPYRCATLLSCL